MVCNQHAFAQEAEDSANISAPMADTSVTVQEDTVPVADSVIFRAIPDTTITTLKARKEFAYANDPWYWKKRQSPNMAAAPSIFKGIEYLLLVIFIAVLAYLVMQVLMKNKMLMFNRKRKFHSTSESEEHNGEPDLEGLVKQYESAGDWRMAARYRYLHLLQQLSQRGLISMHADRTNWDYVNQLRQHPQYGKFRYLTVAYDYVWYGEIQPSPEQYDTLRKNFESFAF